MPENPLFFISPPKKNIYFISHLLIRTCCFSLILSILLFTNAPYAITLVILLMILANISIYM
ncbi:hypothetical protein BDC45DRAFT_520059 [Circinella umbellata]|nr:hypothetical protein BDC45DRAFT_520059 [Circinella umbellata]